MTREELNKLFTESGLKNTPHRHSIYELLLKESGPIDAESIYTSLYNSKKDISLSTVYRILDSFMQKGLIEKVYITDEKKTLYEISRKEHKHYLVCTKCKGRTEVNTCPLGDYEKEVEEITSFSVTGHKLELYGCCSSCSKDKKC